MAAELYIRFNDNNWYTVNREIIKEQIVQLNTFVRQENNEFWLKGFESVNNPYYDVRLFLQYSNYILLEITFHPSSIENTLRLFLHWLRSQTSIYIEDEDREPSNW